MLPFRRHVVNAAKIDENSTHNTTTISLKPPAGAPVAQHDKTLYHLLVRMSLVPWNMFVSWAISVPNEAPYETLRYFPRGGEIKVVLYESFLAE